MNLIDRLLAAPIRPTIKMPLGNGQDITVPGLGYNFQDDDLRKEAALEIKSLIAQVSSWKACAQCIGENLSDVGPQEYYDMKPHELHDWCIKQIEELKKYKIY